MKCIDWEDNFRLGWSIIRLYPCRVVSSYRENDIIIMDLQDNYETITFTERFNIAPCNIDTGIHKVNKYKWKYYTFKDFGGAVVFLGSK